MLSLRQKNSRAPTDPTGICTHEVSTTIPRMQSPCEVQSWPQLEHLPLLMQSLMLRIHGLEQPVRFEKRAESLGQLRSLTSALALDDCFAAHCFSQTSNGVFVALLATAREAPIPQARARRQGRESKEEREHREEGEGAKRTRERVQIAQGHHERERLGTPVHARARVFVHEGRSHECREPQTHTRAPFPLPSNLTTNPPETQIFSVA